VDVDRLQSALLDLRLAIGKPDMQVLAPLGWADVKTEALVYKQGDFLPKGVACNAHRQGAPLFVRVCQVFAAHSMVGEALRQLRYVTNDLQRFDLETVRHAERILLRLVRRMRLNDEGESTDTTLLTSLHIEDLVLTWSLTALDGTKRPASMPNLVPFENYPRAVHGAWSTRFALEKDAASETMAFGQAQLLPALDTSLSGADYDLDQASLNLDLLELRALADVSGTRLPREKSDLYVFRFDPLHWCNTHTDEPAGALRLILRAIALDDAYQLPAVPIRLLNGLGVRRAAEIALDEAEMLGLRLPEHALRMMDWASEQFQACGDFQGAFFASTLAALLQAYRLPVAPSPIQTDVAPEVQRFQTTLQ
jgi:hypothetical protein